MQARQCAIYCRISRDKAGAGLGVERQEADCRALAAREGLTVVEVLSDNDLTAYSGKPRPAYISLLDRIRKGSIDVVLAWHTDRVHRSPVELEDFIAACEIHGVTVKTVQAGAIDLSSASGRMGARIYGAVARHEVEHAIERVKAAKLQQARAGLFSGGQRPFGYNADCTELVEPEAGLVREVAARVTQGASFRSVALDLNARGIKTTNGCGWSALKVRNMLTHKRYTGIREHHDTEYEAQWPAILTRDEWAALQLAILQHARLYKQRGPARKFLLTGFAVCGLCGGRMNTSPRQSGGTRYVCTKFSDERGEIGCGKVVRMVEPTDYLITESILERLDSQQFAEAVAQARHGQDGADHFSALLDEHRQQEARLAEIAEDYGSCRIDKKEYTLFKASADARLQELRKSIEAATSHATAGNLPTGSARAAWDRSDLAWRRSLVDMLISKVVIHPSPTASQMRQKDRFCGKWRFRPEDIEICWKY